jgi:hypothetical protein
VGQWKLVSAKGGEWELYDLENDPLELDDRAEAEPDHLKELVDAWKAESKRHAAQAALK